MAFDAFADFRMNGHVAIVTGGAQNIGEAVARTFAGAGAKAEAIEGYCSKAHANNNVAARAFPRTKKARLLPAGP
jgi:NAD(P)-dependent dehydrogenase (short-subunit alcohol dehydrogenase family)